MAQIAFNGVRSSADWLSQYLEEDWRAGVALLEPNIKSPVTFLASLAKKEQAVAPIYDWFSESQFMGMVAITGVYTEPTLTSAYQPANQGACVAEGGVLYLKMSEDDSKRLDRDHRVRITEPTHRVDLQADIIAVVQAGASSYVAVRMVQGDTYGASPLKDLSDATRLIDLGRAAPEYSTWGQPKQRDPNYFVNYTQIWHRCVAITGTEAATKNNRLGDTMTRAQKQAIFDMNRDHEFMFLFGRPSTSLGSNGKPRRTTAGVAYMIEQNASANRRDYRTDALIAGGTSWKLGGMEWLNDTFMNVFKYGGDTRLGLVGDQAIMAINALVENATNYNIYHGESAYGINISVLETPFGVVALHRHQLFTMNAPDSARMMLIEPGNLGIKELRPFAAKKDLTAELGSAVSVDGITEGFIAESGTLIDFPETMADLRGLGSAHDA